ncbi:tyrosine-protein phosphatase [Cryobacterium sp. CG_9.6]|uniref:tyrosine-protein phosphatase n=1 Tax=Cryobacterium sp. CG_9.6 TaxID=2760710 RepID=UPI002473FDE7|nr:tyrosine-protein phosphatase [Cryobacterium sp. CG_9.6]MDH6236330.1 protein tyrosine/serine phosphatase [Cryobacterium sp. CG_9.6]
MTYETTERAGEKMTTLAIEGTFNVRASEAGADGTVWLFRSATLDGLSARGERDLLELGVGIVIDFRDDVERTHTSAHHLPVEHVPIYGSIDGPPRVGSLHSVYRLILSTRGDRVTQAVIAIARSEHPVLVHCTAGKDRTGLVVALALLAAGRSRAEAVTDYSQSGAQVSPHRRSIVESQLALLGLTDAEYADARELHLDSPASALEHALDYLDEDFGGVQSYLTQHGATDSDFALLQHRLGGGLQ